MRQTLNGILLFIGASSLTDDEWSSIDLGEEPSQVEIYNALLSILEARESVSSTLSRLKYYFQAKGVEVEAAQGQSNIFVGGALCE